MEPITIIALILSCLALIAACIVLLRASARQQNADEGAGIGTDEEQAPEHAPPKAPPVPIDMRRRQEFADKHGAEWARHIGILPHDPDLLIDLSQIYDEDFEIWITDWAPTLDDMRDMGLGRRLASTRTYGKFDSLAPGSTRIVMMHPGDYLSMRSSGIVLENAFDVEDIIGEKTWN